MLPKVSYLLDLQLLQLEKNAILYVMRGRELGCEKKIPRCSEFDSEFCL